MKVKLDNNHDNPKITTVAVNTNIFMMETGINRRIRKFLILNAIRK